MGVMNIGAYMLPAHLDLGKVYQGAYSYPLLLLCLMIVLCPWLSIQLCQRMDFVCSLLSIQLNQRMEIEQGNSRCTMEFGLPPLACCSVSDCDCID